MSKRSHSRWSPQPISSIADINPTTSLPRDGGSVPYYEMAAIDESNGELRAPEMVSMANGRSGKTKFRNGDVLFAKITPCVQNRKSALVRGIPGDLAFGSSEFYVLRAGKRVLPELLYFFIRQQKVIDAAVAGFTGTSGRKRVPRKFWDTMGIPVPPLPVQERIVQILQKADDIRRKRQEALGLADAILPAIFSGVFGSPGSNPHGYEKTSLGKVTDLITSGYTPRGGARNYVAEGPLLIRSQNVRMLHLDLSECAHLPESIHEEMARIRVFPGDVLLNITGASIGRVAWSADDIPPANVNQHVCIIRTDKSKALPEYLAYTLATPWYQHIILNAPGSAQTGFNHTRVRALEVLVPPMPIQKSFVAQVEALRRAQDQCVAGLDDIETALQTLMAQAFTGELTAEWEAANAEEIAARAAFHERLPRFMILALLVEKAKCAGRKVAEAAVLITALMKYVFLLQMEGNGSRRRLYSFVPHHYGPFAKELYVDLEKLKADGLVTVDNETEEDKTRITLTDPAKAEEAIAALPEDLKGDAATVVETYGDLNHNALLKAVYKKYPAYARKSRLRRGARKKGK